MREWLFGGWDDSGRVLVQGALAYAALVLLLRLSGKRTLAKMNAFDLVVTVALGSTLATIILSRDVAVSTGVAALAVLVSLQFAVSWLSVRWRSFRNIIRSEPRLLASQGELLHHALKQERITEDEVTAAVRSAGRQAVSEVDAVVLETDGSFSVLVAADGGGGKSSQGGLGG